MVLPGVDHTIELTHVANVRLIHNDNNLISQIKRQPSTSLGLEIFKGPLDMTVQVDTLTQGGDRKGVSHPT